MRRRQAGLTLVELMVVIAVIAVLLKYWQYVTNPWTRDGRVRANVIEVAGRVSGPIVDLPIVDNQFVQAGEIDRELGQTLAEHRFLDGHAQAQ